MPFADNYTCIDSETRNNLVGIIEQRINQIQEELQNRITKCKESE